eukprot:CAMPEP_0180275518 /NCGR_PEP_ID=MMETSP0988-20121125/5885_1 /TAXON_ID=697907 /ORGANISM="non described non described, Strain CCMP2293" /LENGTH=91 /DNA_ID=CAMNT_0022246789 /DNA_START=55 /DNA_END=331 /DNA_ORIENTATION=-
MYVAGSSPQRLEEASARTSRGTVQDWEPPPDAEVVVVHLGEVVVQRLLVSHLAIESSGVVEAFAGEQAPLRRHLRLLAVVGSSSRVGPVLE